MVGFNEERKGQERRIGRVWGNKKHTWEVENNGERERVREVMKAEMKVVESLKD